MNFAQLLPQILPFSAFLVGASNTDTRQLLSLGDSYTIGEGVPTSERWPHQLVRGLNAQQFGFAQPDYVAKTGWSTDELMRGIQAEQDLLTHYDLVTLQIGVNNHYRSRLASGYERELSQLVRVAVRFAGMRPRRVLLVSIPDWGVTPFARSDSRTPDDIRSDIDEYNAIGRQVAEGFGAHFVDITECSRAMPEALIGDYLHPSGAAYSRWTSIILPVALDALKPAEVRPDYVAP
jgi:lysophospholipase L1-like esterase